MAYHKPTDAPTGTFAFASTGIRGPYRMVSRSTAGLKYPNGSTLGEPVTGVLISSGSAGSTDHTVHTGGVVQMGGIAKVEAEASTLSAGNLFAASTVGRAMPVTAGAFVVGRVLEGSSGGANRVLTVALSPLGTSRPSTALK